MLVQFPAGEALKLNFSQLLSVESQNVYLSNTQIYYTFLECLKYSFTKVISSFTRTFFENYTQHTQSSWIYNDTHIYREKWESRPSYWFLSRESFTVYSSKILNSIVYSKLAVTCTRILANSIYISIRQGLADVQYEIVQAFPLQMSSHFDFLVGMVTLTLWLLDWSQNWPNCYFTLSNTVPDDFTHQWLTVYQPILYLPISSPVCRMYGKCTLIGDTSWPLSTCILPGSLLKLYRLVCVGKWLIPRETTTK